MTKQYLDHLLGEMIRIKNVDGYEVKGIEKMFTRYIQLYDEVRPIDIRHSLGFFHYDPFFRDVFHGMSTYHLADNILATGKKILRRLQNNIGCRQRNNNVFRTIAVMYAIAMESKKA